GSGRVVFPLPPGRISARDRPDSPHALAAGGSTAIQHRISQWILPQRTDQIPTRQQFVDEPRPVTDRTAGRSADGCRSLPSQSSTASRPRRTSSGSAGWTTEVSLSSYSNWLRKYRIAFSLARFLSLLLIVIHGAWSVSVRRK